MDASDTASSARSAVVFSATFRSMAASASSAAAVTVGSGSA